MKVQRPFLQVFAVPESELQVFKSCCKKVTFFLFSKISNFYAGMSGGSHLIVTPQGKTLQTNPNDTVMGSTKVNDFVSGNEGSMPLGANMKDTNQRLDKLNQNIETLVNLTRGNAGKIIDGIGGLT